MSGRIYLVRHGETPQNAEGRYVSSGDPSLSSRGLEQARALGRSIGTVSLDGVFCSPMARTRQTAETIVGKRHGVSLVPVIDERLRELGFGEVENLGPDELGVGRMRSVFEGWRQGVPPIYPKGAEDFEDAARRIGSFWSDHVSDDSHILIVSHSHIIRVLISATVLGVPAELHRRLKIDTGRMAVVEWEMGAPRLVALNTVIPPE